MTEYIATTRNEEVGRTLDETYRDEVPEGLLRVFCISNLFYWDHRNKPKEEATPFLTLSGILGLRRHCIAVVGDSQCRIATNYIRNEIPGLFADVNLWVQSGSGTLDAERRREVREALDTLDAGLTRVMPQIYLRLETRN